MTKTNQFWKGMLIGALAGGAISLLDKQTRQIMKENVQKTSNKVGYILRNPGEICDKIKVTAGNLRSTFEQVSEDISYLADKVDELREITPQVKDIVKETKDTFTKNEEQELLEEVKGEEEQIY